MANSKTPLRRSTLSDLRVITKPKNVLKTLAAATPLAAAAAEMLGQIEFDHLEDRVGYLEASEKLRRLEGETAHTRTAHSEWAATTSLMESHTADLCVFYDGECEATEKKGHKLFLPVAHACILDSFHVLTTSEALLLSQRIAAQRSGSVVLVAGLSRFAIDARTAQEAVGLAVLPIGERDIEWDQKRVAAWIKAGLERPKFALPISPLAHSFDLWVGLEVGFLHTGEAKGAERLNRISCVQFDTAKVSHFLRPSPSALKVAVTETIGSRILRGGSPVFTKAGTLVGAVADTTAYEADAGRRVVFNGLIGHPFFTKPIKKAASPS